MKFIKRIIGIVLIILVIICVKGSTDSLAQDKSQESVTQILEPLVLCTRMWCDKQTAADGSCIPCNKCGVNWVIKLEEEKTVLATFLTKLEPQPCEHVKDDCSPSCKVKLEAKGYFAEHKFFVEDWKIFE